MERKNIIKARAIVQIIYSTVTNTSKKISYMLQDKLESQNFLSTITNIGDINQQQFLELSGPVVMIMSTYGYGGSPPDGEEFIQFLSQLQKKNYFSQVQLSIFGLGNRTFQHFCGNSVTVRELMLHNGAKQILQFVKCNSSSIQQSAVQKFPQWSDQLIYKLKQKYQIKQINAEQLLQKFKLVTTNEQINQNDWIKQQSDWQSRLRKEFLSYHKSFKADVIHIKQLRQQKDGRSTLWIRLKTPQEFKIQPACNISVYPENVKRSEGMPIAGTFYIQAKKKNIKIPYPRLPLKNLFKIANFNQIADLNLIKYAIFLSEKPAQIKIKYQKFLKNPQQLETNPIRCEQLYQDLSPGLDFVVELGINSVRAYTIASWSEQKQYFDLVVSIDPDGLTSKYFQSIPLQMKILHMSSTFYVPQGRPVLMIANGCGIAPFRSLTQYFISQQQAPSLFLYFGIQNKKNDFYFKQQWQKLQKQGKIVLKVAQSRGNPEHKVYVQNLVKQDKQLIFKHLFEDKGVIFICGSGAMAKSVDTELFEVIKLKQPIPFKAFKLQNQLVKNKTIVKQVFN